MFEPRLNPRLVAALIAAGLVTSLNASAEPLPTDPHVTSAGLPLAERASLSLETATTLFTTRGTVPSAVMLDLVTGIPITERVIADVRLPITSLSVSGQSATSVGNLMVGVHYVMNLDRHMWLTIGGALGIPLSPRDFVGAAASSGAAYWNLHEVYPGVVPLYGRIAFEDHFDSIVLRAEAEPVFYAPYGDSIGSGFGGGRASNAQFSLQHAIEVQFGGSFGGGFRLQGFLFPTNDGPFGTGDLYQLAMEPFLFAEKSTLFARLGLMLPLDKELGPPARNFVGIRFATGVRFD